MILSTNTGTSLWSELDHYLILMCVCVYQIAKVEKLKPLEVELRRLEDLSESIVNDFAYMKKREEEMRDTNGERTSACNTHPVTMVSGVT